MNYKQKIAYNTLAQLASRAVTTLCSIAIVFLLTRYLGLNGFGQYNTAIAFAGLFMLFLDFGIQAIGVRELTENESDFENIAYNIIVFRLLSALPLFLALIIALVMPYAIVVKQAIALSLLSTFLLSLTFGFMPVFQVKYRMDLPALIEALGRVMLLGFIIVVIQVQASLLTIFWLTALNALLIVTADALLLNRFISLRLRRPNGEYLAKLLRECAPMGVAVLLNYLAYKFGVIILSLRHSESAVGIYSVAFQIFENLLFIPAAFIGLLLPRLTQLYRENREDLGQFLVYATDLLMIFSLPILTFLFVFAPFIVHLMGGESFTQAVVPLRILLISVSGFFLAYPFMHLLIAAGQQKLLMLSGSVAATITIATNLLLVDRYSYVGSALAMAITGFVYFLVLLVVTARYLQLRLGSGLWRFMLILPLASAIPYSTTLIPYGQWAPFIAQPFITQMAIVVILFALSTVVYFAILLKTNLLSRQMFVDILWRKK